MASLLHGASVYEVHDTLGRGGMASVSLGRVNSGDFSRLVAVKRLHDNLARDARLVTMLLDEARIVSRVHHPYIIDVVDVVRDGEAVFLVMDFVLGEALATLLSRASQAGSPLPAGVVVAVMGNVLRGLEAAHQATDEWGEPIELVHRDVTPQNVMVGVDGLARLFDFGVARAQGRLAGATRHGELKGKLAYVAPEYVEGRTLTRAADVYSAGVVAWECFTGRRLHAEREVGALMQAVLTGRPEPLRRAGARVPAELEAAVERALARQPERRFGTALAFAQALEAAVSPAAPEVVAEVLRRLCRETLEAKVGRIRALEQVAPPAPTEVLGLPGVSSRPAPAPTDPALPAVTLVEEAPAEGAPAELSRRPARGGRGRRGAPSDGVEPAVADLVRELSRQRRGLSWWMVVLIALLSAVVSVVLVGALGPPGPPPPRGALPPTTTVPRGP